MGNNDIVLAVNQICAERNIDPNVVFAALQSAIAEAYKREHGEDVQVKVEIDKLTGQFHLYVVKEVVKTVSNIDTELAFSEAKTYSKEVKIGDNLEMEIPVGTLGRIAAQVAKHTILGIIRDAERASVVEFYQTKKGELVTGKVQGVRADLVLVELEKGVGELPEEEQIRNEYYEIGKRYRFIVKELINEENDRHVILSRSDNAFIEALFRMEVPELENEQIEIREIARFPGLRSKVAVASLQEGLDAQGACIGQRGMRITAIMNELGDEKIDIIKWDLDPVEFIRNSLSPANVIEVEYDSKKARARVVVEDDQLSLAIGREGANVRLASEITGVDLFVESESGEKAEIHKKRGAKDTTKEEDKKNKSDSSK